MSEPVAILIEAHISEGRLASFFGRSVAYGHGRALVGHVLFELVNVGDSTHPAAPDEGNLIVQYDPGSDTLFLAWVVAEDDPLDPMWPVLETLARQMEPTAVGRGTVAPMGSSGCYESVRIENRTLIRGPEEDATEDDLNHLWERFWAASGVDQQGQDGEPDAVERPNYLCDALLAIWPDYVTWRCEERRAQVAIATETKPVCLVDQVYYLDGQVVERLAGAKANIPFPGADPLTFRKAAGFYVDKNHVWQERLAANAPATPEGAVYLFNEESVAHRIFNRDAIWEYVPVEGAVGADFAHVDTFFFWTDRQRIFAKVGGLKGELVALPGVNASEFRRYGKYHGTDGKSVFYGATRLPLRVDRLQTDVGFVWDDENVFFHDFKLPLSGATFRVRRDEHNTYWIADANRALVLSPGNTLTLDDADI